MIPLSAVFFVCVLICAEGRHVVDPDKDLSDFFGGLVHPIKWGNYSWNAKVKGPMTVVLTEKKMFKLPSFELSGDERECNDLLKLNSALKSGVYRIRPQSDLHRSFDAYCDMQTDGGGWTVFQRRADGSEDFQRNYADYRTGFGNLSREFWLGNDALHAITQVGRYHLRIDMETFSGDKLYAKYTTFSVGDEKSWYKLQVSGFSGNAGDSMAISNGAKFSTKDKDQDAWRDNNCAVYYSPFWHMTCMFTTPNGHYMRTGSYTAQNYKYGITWYTYKNSWNISMKKFSMMIRRA